MNFEFVVPFIGIHIKDIGKNKNLFYKYSLRNNL